MSGRKQFFSQYFILSQTNNVEEKGFSCTQKHVKVSPLYVHEEIFKFNFSDSILNLLCIFLVIVRRGAVALYPFNIASKNRDISGYVNPPAEFVGVRYSFGPDKNPQSALAFSGKRNSYVLIPNNGCLDTRYSMTLALWVYPQSDGSLVHFNPNGRGVRLWIDSTFKVDVRFIPRSGKSVVSLKKQIPRGRWSHLATTYNHKDGLATLWLNSIPVDQQRVGRFPSGLATNFPIVIGGKPRDKRRFRGKISCLQIYNFPLNKAAIYSKMTRCFSRGENCSLLVFYHLLL